MAREAVAATPPAAFHGGANLDRITVQSESGGKRYAPGGGYLTSPKGAMGEWQVMPSTARDPGFGIAPWNGSPNDLARVGQQYRATMGQRYGGDPSKMWGAYNAGPGRVDGLIARHGDNWLDFAPAETRSYVQRNLKQLRGR